MRCSTSTATASAGVNKMKLRIFVTLKPGVLDPQGRAIHHALGSLGFAGKCVLVREDLNVPMADGRVTDDTRLRATLATVTKLADRGAKVLVLAHFGRPKGQPDHHLYLPVLPERLGRLRAGWNSAR